MQCRFAEMIHKKYQFVHFTDKSNRHYDGIYIGLPNKAMQSAVVIPLKKRKHNKQHHNSSWCQPLLPSLQWGRGVM